VPVLVGRDRGLVGLRAQSAFGADVIVLDDGFQHHRVWRDVDLLSFDGTLGLGNRRVLPRGPLREPLGALARADAIGVVDGPLPERDERLIAWRAPRAYRFAMRREPSALRPLAGGERIAPESLAGERVGLLAAVARPESVRRTLAQLGAQVVAERLFRDHHRFAGSDLADLADQAPRWITTEKDAVKLVPAWAGRARIDVLAIELVVDAPDALLDWLEARLRQPKR
jgi:tetraacyldisaccharide 4'-kinase